MLIIRKEVDRDVDLVEHSDLSCQAFYFFFRRLGWDGDDFHSLRAIVIVSGLSESGGIRSLVNRRSHFHKNNLGLSKEESPAGFSTV